MTKEARLTNIARIISERTNSLIKYDERPEESKEFFRRIAKELIPIIREDERKKWIKACDEYSDGFSQVIIDYINQQQGKAPSQEGGE